MPEANELTIHIMAAVAQAERKAISTRTKEALAAAKARGVRLGGNRGNLEDLRKGPAKSAEVRTAQATQRAEKVRRQIAAITASGTPPSLRQIAQALNERGITAPRGGIWHAAQVRAVFRKQRRYSGLTRGGRFHSNRAPLLAIPKDASLRTAR